MGAKKVRKNVTMSDIAKALSVSTVTVSKALGNKEGVSERVREEIIRVAEEMGYVYNLGNKEDEELTHYNIGIIVNEIYMNDTGNSFYWKIYQHITNSLKKNNCFGILELLDMEAFEKKQLPKIAAEKKVDGIILLGQMDEKYVEALYSTGIPIVLLDFYTQDAKYDSITSDSFYSSYMLTNHLIINGHKKIAFVGNIYATSSILDRYLGYMKSLIEHRIEQDKDYVLCDRDEVGHYIDLELPQNMPTAFVCNCDEVAYLLINTLRAKGLEVPKDISVVGFDNYVFSNLISPALTTVEVNGEEMAETAVHTIIKKLKGGRAKIGRKIISSNIIYRDSVKDINS